MAGLAVIKPRTAPLAIVRPGAGLAKIVVGENFAEAARQANLAIAAAAAANDDAATINDAVDDAQSAATAAQAAQTAAENARDATLAAYDSFDDRYLGAKSSNPSTDNDGNTLLAGALYYNTAVPEMRLWTGSAWVAAYVSGGSFLALSGGTLTGGLILVASASGTVPLRITQGSTPSSLTNGDTWITSSGLFFRYNATTGQVSGTNTGDQTITLTGDVTGTGTGSFAATIANSAVTLAKMANMATASLIYRKTAGSGAPEVNSLATLKTDLGLTGTNSGDQTYIDPRYDTGSGSGTFTLNANSYDGMILTGLSGTITLANPSGTLRQGQPVLYRLKDNGTSRTWNWGSNFRGVGITLPSATTAGKTHYVFGFYNSTDTKIDVLRVATES